jgi:hypothetical protein
MSPWAAWIEGVRRVVRAPWLLVGVYAALAGLTLPLALVVRGAIADHLGSSLVAGRVLNGVALDWWDEFTAQAAGLSATFTPGILGFGGTLWNLSGVLDGVAPPPILQFVLGAAAIGATFLWGGLLDRLARARPLFAYGFFAAAGGYFGRLLRLNLLALAAYALWLGPVHGLLFDDLYPWLIRDLTVERTAFLARLTLYLAFGLPLLALNLGFDYARVRLVVEDRRSALGSLAAGWRFVRRRPIRTGGLYALNGAAFLALLGAWMTLAPGGGASGRALWLAFGLSQLYVLARLALRLVFAASEVAYFQSELAHRDYAAGPPPAWPDSPAVEAVSRPH